MAALCLLAGCDGPQSILTPRGTNAAATFDILLVLFIGGAVIFVAVMAVAAWALFARPESFRGERVWVIGGGAVFPVVALTGLQIYEFDVARRLVAPPAEPARELRIAVDGWMWWWDVRYRGTAHGDVRTANEIVLPAGRPVTFEVTGVDVIHSFWMPNLAGKIDMIPGLVNTLTLTATEPGVYRGQCAEYCGAQHTWMAFDVTVLEPDRFDAWLAGRTRPAAEPDTPQRERGLRAFLASGCGSCHTIRGTPADGRLGPDLTHVGARRTIGAGMFPTNVGTLAGWIASAQHLKPNNRMPSYDRFDGETLRAIAAYLAGLT